MNDWFIAAYLTALTIVALLVGQAADRFLP